ncbi:C-terminal binding protein [Ensifer sp. YR511]|uniref:C-terminal binding protein n=1 Tax=Ensifer sp. YR511 TaxID=1855294 RepID=UPI00088E7804|nr:C-terminal binding protein [Ensifer sp. YR511]SDN34803.1 D-3-phosphoglycerate dehydrogenase [Ensifer sp. YR511]
MRKAKVVLTDYVWNSLDVEHRLLDEYAVLRPLQTKSAADFVNEATDCDALLNTYAGPITADVMAAMPNCKIIARYGIGVDTIDIDAATAAGIIVTNNPTYCVEEVADHAMAMLLASLRKITFFDRQVRNGSWDVSSGKPIHRLSGLTLGLVGFGNIARAVARRAEAFAMRVVFYDPFVGASLASSPHSKVAFEELLRISDVVSLHPPLTPKTRGLIGDDAFKLMKPTAHLINVARGPIVDTDALVRALDERLIAGCALDTTDPEPLPNPHPLRDRPNAIITPHSAWYSEDSMIGLQSGAPSEVQHVLCRRWPTNVVNPDVRGKNRAGL